MDAVAGLLADLLAQRRLDREPVRAVAPGHQRADERLAVDRAADLHEAAGAESSATSSMSTHVHAPGLSPF